MGLEIRSQTTRLGQPMLKVVNVEYQESISLILGEAKELLPKLEEFINLYQVLS